MDSFGFIFTVITLTAGGVISFNAFCIYKHDGNTSTSLNGVPTFLLSTCFVAMCLLSSLTHFLLQISNPKTSLFFAYSTLSWFSLGGGFWHVKESKSKDCYVHSTAWCWRRHRAYQDLPKSSQYAQEPWLVGEEIKFSTSNNKFFWHPLQIKAKTATLRLARDHTMRSISQFYNRARERERERHTLQV